MKRRSSTTDIVGPVQDRVRRLTFRMHERWHELAVKEALGENSYAERLLLDRYQRLVMAKTSREETRRGAELDHLCRKVRKLAGKLERQHLMSSNKNAEPRG